MGKKNKEKSVKRLELTEQSINVSYAVSFGEYGNHKIMLSHTGKIPDGSTKKDIDYTMEGMFDELKNRINELGDSLEEGKDIPF